MKSARDDRDLPAVVAEALARVSRADYARWEAMIHAAGCCAQPVRLAGRVLAADPESGELSLVYSSRVEADRVLLKACETRRATRCPACAAVYRGDAKVLLRRGVEANSSPLSPGTVMALILMTVTHSAYGRCHRQPAGRKEPWCSMI